MQLLYAHKIELSISNLGGAVFIPENLCYTLRQKTAERRTGGHCPKWPDRRKRRLPAGGFESGESAMKNRYRRLILAAAAVLAASHAVPAMAYGPGSYSGGPGVQGYYGGPGVEGYYGGPGVEDPYGQYYSGGPGVGAGDAKENTGNVIYAYPGFNPNVPSFNEYPYDPSYWWDDEDDEDEWDDEDWWYYHEGPGAVYGQGWRYSPGGWWFQLYGGGWLSDGWKMIRNRWYRFDGNGYMVTGWFMDADGNRYYLNPVDDGTLGMMRTGWQVIDGKSYYFNTQSDGTMGRLYVDTTTPDGYRVGADGALVQ